MRRQKDFEIYFVMEHPSGSHKLKKCFSFSQETSSRLTYFSLAHSVYILLCTCIHYNFLIVFELQRSFFGNEIYKNMTEIFLVHRIEFIDFNVIWDDFFSAFSSIRKLYDRIFVQSGCQMVNVQKLRHNFVMTETKEKKKKKKKIKQNSKIRRTVLLLFSSFIPTFGFRRIHFFRVCIRCSLTAQTMQKHTLKFMKLSNFYWMRKLSQHSFSFA